MLRTIAQSITVQFNTLAFTGDVRFDDGTHRLTLLSPSGEEDVLSTSFSNGRFEPQEGAVFIKDYSHHRGIVASLERAGVVATLRTIQPDLNQHVVEVRVLAPAQGAA